MSVTTKPDFWTLVKWRVSQCLLTSADEENRRHWIDILSPASIRRTKWGAIVRGKAWVFRKKTPMDFNFVALVPLRLANNSSADFEIEYAEIDAERGMLEFKVRELSKQPNKALEPTSGTVTSPAEPGAAPVPPVAHL